MEDRNSELTYSPDQDARNIPIDDDTEMTFTEFVHDMFDELSAQFDQKNKQYGTADPLANFTRGAKLRYGEACWQTMFETAKDYESKHIAHVFNNTVDGNKVDESLKDIAVYSVIELYMIYKAKREQ